jgi:hypothetical protein
MFLRNHTAPKPNTTPTLQDTGNQNVIRMIKLREMTGRMLTRTLGLTESGQLSEHMPVFHKAQSSFAARRDGR